MPVQDGVDSQGCFMRWGQSGTKYRYTCGNEQSKKAAIKKAEAQGRAIRASGFRE